jgi:hypothetical protein
MPEQNYDRWHQLYYTTLGFPDEVNEAFATILKHLEEVQEVCNVKVTKPLNKVFDALESLPRDQKQRVNEWRHQVYSEQREAKKKAKIDRIKGFELGQLVKFEPHAQHHDDDGNHPWGIKHIIGRVTRRSTHTVSVIEVSCRRRSASVEHTMHAGRRWRLHPEQDTILDE